MTGKDFLVDIMLLFVGVFTIIQFVNLVGWGLDNWQYWVIALPFCCLYGLLVAKRND